MAHTARRMPVTLHPKHNQERLYLIAGIAGVVITLSFSCASPPPQGLGVLHGVIYSSDGQALFGSRITVSDSGGRNHHAYSDIHGRFRIADVSLGSITIAAEHSRHEPLQLEARFIDRSQVLYLRLTDWLQLLEDWQQALEHGHIPEAAALLERLVGLDCPQAVRQHARQIQSWYEQQQEIP